MGKIIVSSIIVIIILIFMLATYWWRKKFVLPVNDNVLYIMTLPKLYFYIGIFGVVIFGFLMVFFTVASDEAVLTPLIWSIFVFLGVYTCIDARLWRCVITTDSLTIYEPFFPPKHIKFYEITTVKYFENRTMDLLRGGKKMLEGYHKKKKLFSFDEETEGFEVLHYLFLQAGKIERTPIIESFSVTAKSGAALGSVIGFLFFSILWIIVSLTDPLELIYNILVAFLVLLFLSESMELLLRRVTVDFHTISIRNSFGITKTYELNQLTEVIEKENHIVLYVGSKKIAKIPKDLKNFDYLMERLMQIGIVHSK